MESSVLDSLLDRITASRQNEVETANNQKTYVPVSNRDELPFSFNFSEFLPSKDPLSIDLLLECGAFNRKVNKLRQKLKQPEYEWEVSGKEASSKKEEEDVSRLNQDYTLLKKNLQKMNILTSGYSKIATSTSIHTPNLRNVLALPPHMINARTLCLLKSRTAKKLKIGLASVALVWKIANANFSFEEAGTSADLCLGVSAHLVDDLGVWTGEVSKYEDGSDKVDLMICPVDMTREAKASSQTILVSIKNANIRVGLLEVSRSEVDSSKLMGL